MRAFLLGALTALTIMPVNAAEDAQTANFILPYCKLDFKEAGTRLIQRLSLIGHCPALGCGSTTEAAGRRYPDKLSRVIRWPPRLLVLCAQHKLADETGLLKTPHGMSHSQLPGAGI